MASAATIAAGAAEGYPARMIVLRHCQSEFNLHFTRTRRDPGIIDPVLTSLGEQQAEQAALALDGVEITRILVSPYTRALQTALPIAHARGLVPEVTPLVRERYAFTCDIGMSRSELQQRWAELDFGHLDEVWWPLTTETEDEVLGRAERFRGEMAALPDGHTTLVVSHWGFLLALSGKSLENGTFRHVDPHTRPAEPVIWRH
jgi:broad specificity phosphatase PhoE